jgi:hypothetical protein
MVLLCTHDKKYRVSPQQDGGKKRQISTPASAFSAIVGVSLKCVL